MEIQQKLKDSILILQSMLQKRGLLEVGREFIFRNGKKFNYLKMGWKIDF